MALKSRSLLSLLCALLLAGCAGAQGGAPAQLAAAAPSPAPTAAAPPRLCRLPDLPPAELRSKPGYTQLQVVATNAAGAPLTGLKQSDFVVRSGAQPLPIAYFREQSSADTPVSIVLVIDESASMDAKLIVRQGDLAKERTAVDNAARKLNVCDEAALIFISGKYAADSLANSGSASSASARMQPAPSPGAVTLAEPFTTDTALIMEKIHRVRPRGQDRLAEGIRVGLSTLAGAHYPSRALVVVTDGLDATQVERGVRMLEQIRASGTRLYVIGVGDPNASPTRFPGLFRTMRVDAEAIARLAAAGDGQALFASPVDDDNGASMAATIDRIVGEIGHGYAIGVIAPPGGPALTVLLARAATGSVARAEIVAPKILTNAAGL